MTNKITGGCLCGEVRYEAQGPSLGNFVCYCRKCQRATGSVFAALLYINEETFRLTKGSVQSFASSTGVERSFCKCCGSPLFFRRDNRPGQCAFTVGSLDNPNQFEPQTRIFLSDRPSWLETLHTVESYAEKPKGMTPPLNYNPATGKIDA